MGRVAVCYRFLTPQYQWCHCALASLTVEGSVRRCVIMFASGVAPMLVLLAVEVAAKRGLMPLPRPLLSALFDAVKQQRLSLIVESLHVSPIRTP